VCLSALWYQWRLTHPQLHDAYVVASLGQPTPPYPLLSLSGWATSSVHINMRWLCDDAMQRQALWVSGHASDGSGITADGRKFSSSAILTRCWTCVGGVSIRTLRKISGENSRTVPGGSTVNIPWWQSKNKSKSIFMFVPCIFVHVDGDVVTIDVHKNHIHSFSQELGESLKMVPAWTETCWSVYCDFIVTLILFRFDATSDVH
jgi:hypothetical protein